MAHRYEITAHILCHDVRLSTSVTAVAMLDHPPTPDECLAFIYEAADAVVTRAGGEGCPYEVSDVAARVLSTVARNM